MTDQDSRIDEVRRALIEAAGDPSAFAAILAEHEALIVAHAPSWATVPERIRDDAQALERYAEMLMRLASACVERGHPALMQRLMGEDGDNPLSEAERALSRARELMNELDYERAEEVLAELRDDLSALRGPGAAHYGAFALGFAGECAFQRGAMREAIERTEEALATCLQLEERPGIEVYHRNLFEIWRYAGHSEAAADHALALAAIVEPNDPAEAARLRRRATLVREGEPLCRVVAFLGDQSYELDELPPLDDQGLRFGFVRNRVSLRRCAAKVEEGIAHGTDSRFEEAAEAFLAAAEHDPFDPAPWYHLANTYLHQRRYAEAIGAYDRVEALAPGWYHARSDRFLAQLLADDEVPAAIFEAIRSLEDGSDAPIDKLALAEASLATAPDLAHLHLLRGNALVTLGLREDAAQAYRDGLAAPQREPAIETRLLARLGAVLQEPTERQATLRRAVALGADFVSAGMARVLSHAEAH
ncbi:MAG: tetratricopeptide repeat protein [Polyangiaceae bacterium]